MRLRHVHVRGVLLLLRRPEVTDPCWGFRWPAGRTFLSATSAKRRAELLRRLGCEVTVERSLPVEWPKS
jgi:hypothetical protein